MLIDPGSTLTKVSTLSQWRTFRGYQLLTQYVSSIEKKLVDMDVHDLNTYFREVFYTLFIPLKRVKVQTILATERGRWSSG